MSASIVHANRWDTHDKQYFVTLSPGRDEVALYQSQDVGKGNDKIDKIGSQGDFDSIQCYAYSPIENGLVCVGQPNGTASVFNVRDGESGIAKLRPKQARACNSVSFNTSGQLAVGLDKVRNDGCLLLWDVEHYSSRASGGTSDEQWSSRSPLHSYLQNEVVASVSFLPSAPNSLLCGSYKLIREMDIRTNTPSFQFAAKCSQGITVNQTNDVYFASYSEDGSFSIWDRRQIRTGIASSEPALMMNRFFGEHSRKTGNICFRYSLDRSNELTVLHDGYIRRWQMGVVPPFSENRSNAIGRHLKPPHGEPGYDSHHSYLSNHETLFVYSVLDSKTKFDKVVSFDYAEDFTNKHRANFMCIRQSGQVFRVRDIESPDAARFGPYNDLAIVEPERTTLIYSSDEKLKISEPQNELKGRRRRLSSKTSSILPDVRDDEYYSDEEAENLEYEGMLPYLSVLDGDIAKTMRDRAANGYLMDCDANVEVLNKIDGSDKDYLKYVWKWLSLAYRSESKSKMVSNGIDLAFEGVTGIWEGLKGLEGQHRYDSLLTEKEYWSAVDRIISGRKRIFTKPPASSGTTMESSRQLCLRVAGWNFELSELEDKLKQLEKEGKHEQAAGWAVFHGDVERAVTALAASRKERLRLMSTAVAGYLAYKNSNANSPWREQCRKLASELDNSYLRAIFAYISDGSWLDVLDDGSLPLNERLGIALRFLPEQELTVYFNRLTDRAVAHGDLEGIMLTGLTPRAVDLLQSFVDKTCDVQTASLIASFGCPRYFSDKRVENWTEEYRRLLNSWSMFNARAKFDVARTRFSRQKNGTLMISPVPRQIYLRCSHCKKTIKGRDARKEGGMKGGSQSTDLFARCENCSNPLPRCAVCLLPMGSRISSAKLSSNHVTQLTAQLERWPTFCLSCNHGLHAGHAEEWFLKYDICPVPDCNCMCNSK